MSKIKPSPLQPGASLDIPIVSKTVYWVSLGLFFFFIGIFPFLLDVLILNPPEGSPITTANLIIWILVSIWCFFIFCYPRTEILEDGLKVKSIFLRIRKSYKWTDFKTFAITRAGDFGRFFLYLHFNSRRGLVKIGLGKSNPSIVESFLQTSGGLVKRGSPNELTCNYHPTAPAITTCEKCGLPICGNCVEFKIYSYFLLYAPHSDRDLGCMPCFYNQFNKISKTSFYIGTISGIFLLLLPYQGWMIAFNAVNCLIAPIFFGLSIGTFWANKKRLIVMKNNAISFNYEKENQLNSIPLIISVVFSVTIPIRLILLLEPLYLDGSSFAFLIAGIVFIIIHQVLLWATFLKFKP